MLLLLLFIIFAVIFAVVIGCIFFSFSFFKHRQKQQIRSMLRNAEATAAEQRNPDLLKPVQTEDALGNFLRRFKFADHITLMMDQAGSNSTVGAFVVSSVVTGAMLGLVGFKFHFAFPPQIVGLLCASLGLMIPFLVLMKKRSKNISAFEEQLPEALDFLSRSMRAGHGFSVAMEMLATDSPDPLGRAFRRVSNDTALGSSLDVALGKLVTLVPIVDVRFFVSSVILQQDTGGNLGEILTKLSYIIRERFRLKGQVKAVSAHGRVTGLVLLLMPLAVCLILLFSNPSYLNGMFINPIGRWMIYGAVGGQVVGYFVIKKIINIKV